MTRVFVNGCFDLLHIGHLELLNYAREQGDYLLVAIDSDTRVSSNKGPDRPINSERNRAAVLKNFRAVDEVKIFSSDQELIDIIKNYQPDIMIVGSDWRNRPVIGSQYSKSLMFFDRIGNESSTKTIESYLNRRHLHR
jgi:D-beta-D-heptose 7-phosphate kinase/D-beta-D-heptose 1-phosphate adenosyltransferase